MTVQELVALIDSSARPKDSQTQVLVRCPGHDDRSPSLSVWIDDKEKAALHCFAGCSHDQILAGLPPENARLIEATWRRPEASLVIPPKKPTDSKERAPAATGSSKPEAVYVYTDEHGTDQYEVRRYPGKKIRQFHRENGKLITGRGDATLYPYRLPEVLAAIAEGDTVYICEGEKDCETLASRGLAATTNVDGAGKWKPEYNQWFNGANVVILPDNDGPGHKHGQDVASHLAGNAATVRLLELPELPSGGDVTDWLQTHTVIELDEEAAETPTLADDPPIDRTRADERLTLRWANEVTMKRTRWVLEDWVPAGGLSILAGFGGLGKSTYLTRLTAQLTTGQAPGEFQDTPKNVLFLTAEDVWASTVVPRLRAAGADLNKVAFLALNTNDPDEEPTPGTISLPNDLPLIEETLASGDFALVALDPLVSFLDNDTDSHKDASVRQVLDPLNQLAGRHMIGIIGCMHFNKSETKDPFKKLSSSGGFWNAGRAVLFLGQEYGAPRTDRYRYLTSAKNNLAPRPRSIKYRLDQTEVHGGPNDESNTTSKLIYIAPSEIEAHDLFSRKREPSIRDELADGIAQLLEDSGGVMPSSEIRDYAKNVHGAAPATVTRAIKQAGGETFKPQGQGFGNKEWWVRSGSLTEEAANTAISSRVSP